MAQVITLEVVATPDEAQALARDLANDLIEAGTVEVLNYGAE